MEPHGLQISGRQQSVVLMQDETGFVTDWLGHKMGILTFGPHVALAVVGDDVKAGIIFNNFVWPSIEASILSISPKWCNKRILREIFSYPFEQLGCRRVTATTSTKNQPAMAFLKRLGFELEGIARQARPDGDAAVFGMIREECRWLNEQGRPKSS